MLSRLSLLSIRPGLGFQTPFVQTSFSSFEARSRILQIPAFFLLTQWSRFPSSFLPHVVSPIAFQSTSFLLSSRWRLKTTTGSFQPDIDELMFSFEDLALPYLERGFQLKRFHTNRWFKRKCLQNHTDKFKLTYKYLQDKGEVHQAAWMLPELSKIFHGVK